MRVLGFGGGWGSGRGSRGFDLSCYFFIICFGFSFYVLGGGVLLSGRLSLQIVQRYFFLARDTMVEWVIWTRGPSNHVQQ